MRLHYISLVLLLAVAAAILAGGSRLARREQLVRVERDRESIRTFAGLMQVELFRLEKLYENNLGRIARDVPSEGAFEVVKASDWLSGVRQVSVLSTNLNEKSGTKAQHEKVEDRHFAISNPSGQRLPRPVLFQAKDKSPAGLYIVLPDEAVDAAVHESGWIEQPGSPFFFWYRRSVSQYVAILVDSQVVAEAMNRWMKWWVSENYHPVNAGTGGDQLLGPRNSLLASNGMKAGLEKRQPDFVLPMGSRFGSWQLLSWDGWETRRSYHNPTLAASAALSLLVALLGTGLFFQQLRTARIAAHRVSFINRVSHELRTPLTNILLNVDLAAEAIDLNGGPKEAGQRLMLVGEEGRRLGRLIDNVLTFSRKEQGRLKITPRECQPSELVKDVLTQFETALKRRCITVKFNADNAEACVLDADGLKQILTNLVSNVEKYAAGGGLLDISVASREGRLKIVVSDNGPGISADEAEKIFRPFYRLHDEVSEGVTGTGLGLSIARDLALQMGGTLCLLSRDKGAAFELDVPVSSVHDTSIGGVIS